jgi:hypothetical protein
MHFDEWLLVSSLLLLLSIFAWKVSSRLGIPALLLFLGIGMLAGSDGPGGIYFDDALVAQSVGVVALAFILFAGGLETDWKVVRPVLGGALSLSTIGVLLTAVIVAIFSLIVLHFSFAEGLLLGAIISATDAAAVFSVLGARNLHLKGKLLPLLELESGTNDPMAVFLTIGLTRLLTNPQESVLGLLLLFVQQMGVGAVLGLLIGWAAIWLISHLNLDVEGLYRVFTIALVLFTYGLTAWLGGSGFLAVYLVGVLLGNSSVQQVDRLSRFHDSLADANRHVPDLRIARLPLTPARGCGQRTAHHGGCRLSCPPGERLDRLTPREDVSSGKALRWVGGIARSRSDCVSNLPAAGRPVESLVSLRSRLLRGSRLCAASGDVRSFRGPVVGDHLSCNSNSGNEGQSLERKVSSITWQMYSYTSSALLRSGWSMKRRPRMLLCAGRVNSR